MSKMTDSELVALCDAAIAGAIGQGLLVYAGVAVDDAEADVQYIAEKVAGLRIFHDAEGKMNRNVTEAGLDQFL